MFLIVRKLGRRMDLDFALVEGMNDNQAESMFDGVVKIRIKLPDDRYTISFRVYQPRLTMEIVRWPKVEDDEVSKETYTVKTITLTACSSDTLVTGFVSITTQEMPIETANQPGT